MTISKKVWNIIVIGGAAVSRGITLEGLNVSYFTRLAKLPTSDTLIQMGRWFGYRIGYEDLWRVYCPKQLHILFRQFSYVMERARSSFEQMAKDRKNLFIKIVELTKKIEARLKMMKVFLKMLQILLVIIST